MTKVASGNKEFVNSLLGNTIERLNAKFITFYRTYSGLGLLISKAQDGSYVSKANDGSSSIKPDLKFPSSKSNCTDLNKWHVISVTWSNKGENIGDLGIMSGLDKAQLTGCIGEIIDFYRSLMDDEILYIHECLMRKWGITDTIIVQTPSQSIKIHCF